MTAAHVVGDHFAAPPRAMTRERMRWYVDAQATAVANDGKPRFGGPTIHDDDAYAQSQGLPGIIADGMVSTNWILALLIETFGPAAVRQSRLRTKYVSPVYEDDVLTSHAEITALSGSKGVSHVTLKVWCDDAKGRVVTVGEAKVRLVHD